MSALAARTRKRGALRTIGMLSAIALGGVAVYLVVVGHSQKQVQVGLLIGLWGVMLGAFTLFGPRRGYDETDDGASKDLERSPAQRREHELQLEVMLRREMERVLHDELSQLRSEVSGLRNDLVEKVNGQLRLERIETTRVISSDIEELQHEVRRLAVSRGAAAAIDAAASHAPTTIVETRQQVSAPLPYVFAAPPASGPSRVAVPTATPGAGAPSVTPSGTPSGAPRPGTVPAPAAPAAPAGPAWPGPQSPAPRTAAAPMTPAQPRPLERPPAPPAAAPRRPVPIEAAAPRPSPSAPRPLSGEPGAPQPATAPGSIPATRPTASPAPPGSRQPAAAVTPPAAPARQGPPRATVPSASDQATSVLPRQPAVAEPDRAQAPELPARVEWPPSTARSATSAAPATSVAPPVPAAPATPVVPTAPATSVARPAPAASATPVAPAAPEDLLAGLPRLSRFDDDWGGAPGEPSPSAEPEPVEPPRQAPPQSYVGRRRSSSDPWAGDAAAARGTTYRSTTAGDDASDGSLPGLSMPSSVAPTVSVPSGFPPTGAAANGAGSANRAGSTGGAPNGAGSANGATSANGGAPNGAGGNGTSSANGTWTNGARVNGASSNGTPTPQDGARPAAGGRRRRADGEVDEVLARLLGR